MMNIMWRAVEEEVDALVRFHRSLTYPVIQSIRWNRRRVDFQGVGRVERSRHKLTYWLTDGGMRYAVRYEFSRQRWILEGLNDSGMMDPADEIPPPRSFPPPVW